MPTKNNAWNKQELHTYILLLCANADSEEQEEEIELIKRKVDTDAFEKIYSEFSSDTEETRIEKISRAMHLFTYSHMELIALRKEMDAIYFADQNYDMMERNLDRILDNIIY
jgi:hypothetical protein